MTEVRAKAYSWLWVMAALYLGLNTVVSLRLVDLGNSGSVAITVVLFAFVLFYGAKRFGWRKLLIFFGMTSAISWSMESLSIATGFPFGHYRYSDQLGPKLGTVPLIVMPAYFANGFLAWTISHIFLGNLGPGILKRNTFAVPTIAAFVMVMWDFCIDPVTSTIDGDWIWRDGGHYFGVPIKNYFGWFLTVFLIYLAFTYYLRWRESKDATVDRHAVRLPKSYWFLAPVMFVGTAIPGLIHPFSNEIEKYSDIYWSMFLATVMTMVFVSLLAMILVSRFDD